MINPLFKWAGGKRKMLTKYEKEVFIPKDIKCETFVDMFAGAGTMSMWAYQNRDRLGLKKIILNDINSEIIHMFEMMKKNVIRFVKTCIFLEKEYFVQKDYEYRKSIYLTWRDRYANDYTLVDIDKAAHLFCMLKTNFNGIWQSRAKDGIYFTPFGNGKEAEDFIFPDEIYEFAAMLKIADITCNSYEEVHKSVKKLNTAFFYADPPYLSSATKYKKKSGDKVFGEQETKELISYLMDKGNEGSLFALSNKQHELFEGLEGVVVFPKIKYTASRKDTSNATSDEILWTNI